MNQDLIIEGQIQLEASEHLEGIDTEQKMRNLRIEAMDRMPVPELQANLIDQSPEFAPQATDDEDESQENDEPLLPSMAFLRRRVLSKTGNIRKFKKSHSSAAIFLDEPDFLDYGEFDIMDRQRRSIQHRGNMKSWHLNSESGDVIFENRMQLVWEGDRAKKKLRKQGRENLRQLGLLDKKGKASLKSHYTQGFSPDDIVEQIKNFLQSSKER